MDALQASSTQKEARELRKKLISNPPASGYDKGEVRISPDVVRFQWHGKKYAMRVDDLLSHGEYRVMGEAEYEEYNLLELIRLRDERWSFGGSPMLGKFPDGEAYLDIELMPENENVPCMSSTIVLDPDMPIWVEDEIRRIGDVATY